MSDSEQLASPLNSERKAVLWAAAFLFSSYFALSMMSGDGAWVVPVNLPHQGGYPADTPGLRPTNLIESYFLDGSPFYGWLFCSVLVLSFVVWKKKHLTYLASLVTLAVALAALWYTHAPTVRHRCKLPASLCASNLKNIAAGMEFYREEHGNYPTLLSELLPEYIRELPSCPIGGAGYELDSLPNRFAVTCHPHPPYYAGNDCTGIGKGYLSRREGGEVLVYSSDEGLGGFPED